MKSKKIQVTVTGTKTALDLPRTYTRLWISWVSGTANIYLNDDTVYETLSAEGDYYELPMSTELKYPHDDVVKVDGSGVIKVEYESELI